jgi:hypothetical protein
MSWKNYPDRRMMGTEGSARPVVDQKPAGDEVGTGGSLLDAQEFLVLANRLRALRERIEASGQGERRRSHWQRLLVAASDAAKTDFDRADEKLTRLEAELDRFIGDS